MKKVISLHISTGTYSTFVCQIIELAVRQASSYVCVANVHMCIEAFNSKSFAMDVNGANLVTPDGMPLAKAIRLLYGVKQDRVAGMDLLPDLLAEAEQKELGVFFYGGTTSMLVQTKLFVNANYPLLSNQYYYSPPFRPLTVVEEKKVVESIKASGAHLVFVALGCPKQEKWMAAMKGRINACMIGIGGALPVMIGMQKRAPLWMQKLSLEWFYRLVQEPKRLFKRYLITNTLFILLFTKQIIKHFFNRSK
jgi:N-acetylglucosaminyldiphosphoundecaprenol N-acetyl-beta-D-mannosaminyltransferase